MRNLVARLLREVGFQVAAARDGRGMWSVIEHAPYAGFGTREAALARGALGAAHLRVHLAARDAMTEGRRAAYARLRGYAERWTSRVLRWRWAGRSGES